jgi:hypothetical protein
VLCARVDLVNTTRSISLSGCVSDITRVVGDSVGHAPHGFSRRRLSLQPVAGALY